jgi:hypothetical protein
MRRLLAGLLCAVLAADPVHALTVILYARQDRAVVDCLARVAAIYGPVWTDAQIRPGDPWRRSVAQAIGAADVVLVVWSAAAASSAEVGAEWRQALAAGRRVVPVITDSAQVPGELGMLQWLQKPGCGPTV